MTQVGLRKARQAGELAGQEAPAQGLVSQHPHALFGSVDEVCDELERRRELHGISYITVGRDNMESFAPVVDFLRQDAGEIVASERFDTAQGQGANDCGPGRDYCW